MYVCVSKEPYMSKYFTDAIKKDEKVAPEYVEKVSARADENLGRYYFLLRSTGVEGMEELISAIHRSTFSLCHSHSHHHYTTGTLEHCLGVYDEMVRMAEGTEFSQRDIILTALLHDVGKGHSKAFSAYKGHHPERSMKIVRHYLKHVPGEVLNAIRYHQHHHPNHPLQNLVCDADHKDASTCNRTSEFLKAL